jgi:hypothetical protein
MGNYWDIPGDGDAVNRSGLELQLWELPYKFQRYPERDRRYKFQPLWNRTRKVEDIGYYLVESMTNNYICNTAEDSTQLTDGVVPTGPVFIKSAQAGGQNAGYWDQPGGKARYGRGDNIGMWSRDGGRDQQFRFEPLGGGWYRIVSLNNGTLDVSGGRNADGVNIQVWDRNNSDAQKFRLQHLGQGRWKIYTSQGRAICTPRNYNNGSNVHIWLTMMEHGWKAF